MNKNHISNSEQRCDFAFYIPAFSYFKNIIQKMENRVNENWQKNKNNYNKKAKINMVIYMSISWLKASSDRKSFKIFESFGMDVYKINDLEKTDEKIRELVDKNYTTIVVSNEVASFSEDIIKNTTE